MLLRAASSEDLIKTYYDSLDKLHATVLEHAPFTYLAYRSMIPGREDDFVVLAYKISYYVTFKFLIQLGINTGSVFCGVLPFLPFVMDVLWVGYRSISDLTAGKTKEPANNPLTTLFYLSLGLIAMHYLDQVPNC